MGRVSQAMLCRATPRPHPSISICRLLNAPQRAHRRGACPQSKEFNSSRRLRTLRIRSVDRPFGLHALNTFNPHHSRGFSSRPVCVYLNRKRTSRQARTTTVQSSRRATAPHGFSSEGEYWWLELANPAVPYILCGGMTNPDNFVANRQLLLGFLRDFGTLVSAVRHAPIWLGEAATRMNPSLLYSQAIKGRSTSRSGGFPTSSDGSRCVRAGCRRVCRRRGAARRQSRDRCTVPPK